MGIQAFNTRRFMVSLLLAGTLLLGGALQNTALAQATQDAIRNYNQGIEAYSQGRTIDALKKFQHATQLDPTYGDAYYNIGSIYYQMKQYDLAEGMFQKAVNLSPNDGQAKLNLGLTLEKLSRYEEAINVLSQIPATDPKSAQAKAKIEEMRPALKPQVKTASLPAGGATAATAAKKVMGSNKALFSKGYDGPTGITIGPGGFMYVANYSKNLIYRVGANGDKTVFSQGDQIKGPIGLVYNPKTNELYVANYLLNNVVRINAAGKTSVLSAGLGKPYNLYLDSVNNMLYVSEQEGNVISRVSLP